MASSSVPAATADTSISLKVNLDGTTRRFKLPLRDLVVVTFEKKVCLLLFLYFFVLRIEPPLTLHTVDPRRPTDIR